MTQPAPMLICPPCTLDRHGRFCRGDNFVNGPCQCACREQGVCPDCAENVGHGDSHVDMCPRTMYPRPTPGGIKEELFVTLDSQGVAVGIFNNQDFAEQDMRIYGDGTWKVTGPYALRGGGPLTELDELRAANEAMRKVVDAANDLLAAMDRSDGFMAFSVVNPLRYALKCTCDPHGDERDSRCLNRHATDVRRSTQDKEKDRG